LLEPVLIIKNLINGPIPIEQEVIPEGVQWSRE
jgi:hypothetical protein